jgi:Protein of unknown function (DUF2971)
MAILYKYRSLHNFKNFVDILLNGRLYAAPYFELNDPMEGYYLYGSAGEMDLGMRDLLKGEKEKIRILSLSRRPDIELMWAHYADGNKGVAIGVEIHAEKHTSLPVIYDGPLTITAGHLTATTAIDVLSRKLPAWQYEEEERVFTTQGHFVGASVREVIMGSRMSNQDKSLIRNLVGMLLPHTKILSQRNNNTFA